MGREEGYYWVLSLDGWRVAYWKQHQWWLAGGYVAYPPGFFEEIDERRLVRTDEVE